jgi:AraC-like DNA-binding protein
MVVSDAGGTVADMARIELSGGACNVLRAEHFARPFPPHFHDTFAIGVVERGAAIIRTLAGEWTARAGSLLTFAPGEIHSAEPATSAGYSYRMVYPSGELAHEIRAGAQHGHFRAPVIHDASLGGSIARAHRTVMDGATSTSAEGRLLGGMRKLFARYTSSVGTPARRASDSEVVERARAMLEERVRQRVRLVTVAEGCGVSPYYLIRVFRRVLGVTPHAYLVQLRVNRAQAMLAAGSRLVDVAYDCGFSDQSHLTRAFKSAIGVPPGQFMRQVAGAT